MKFEVQVECCALVILFWHTTHALTPYSRRYAQLLLCRMIRSNSAIAREKPNRSAKLRNGTLKAVWASPPAAPCPSCVPEVSAGSARGKIFPPGRGVNGEGVRLSFVGVLAGHAANTR